MTHLIVIRWRFFSINYFIVFILTVFFFFKKKVFVLLYDVLVLFFIIIFSLHCPLQSDVPQGNISALPSRTGSMEEIEPLFAFYIFFFYIKNSVNSKYHLWSHGWGEFKNSVLLFQSKTQESSCCSESQTFSLHICSRNDETKIWLVYQENQTAQWGYFKGKTVILPPKDALHR